MKEPHKSLYEKITEYDMYDKKVEEEKEIDEIMENLLLAIHAIQSKEGVEVPRKVVVGDIPCPVCENKLFYRISSINGHIWGQCSLQGCLNWVQ